MYGCALMNYERVATPHLLGRSYFRTFELIVNRSDRSSYDRNNGFMGTAKRRCIKDQYQCCRSTSKLAWLRGMASKAIKASIHDALLAR